MAYSFSQLQTYLKCPLRYRLEKIDKEDPLIPQFNLNLTLWICVHSALEDLYRAKSDTILMEESQLLEAFDIHWKEKIDNATEINWWTNPFNEYDLTAFYGRWVEYMKYYYNEYYPFDQAVAMKMESPISFEIEEGIHFWGKIDRLDIDGDTLIINDYKTNKSLPKDSNNTIEDQITLYAIGVLKDYGKQINHLKWRVIYLHLKDPHEWDITTEKIEEVKNKYLDIIKEIEERKNRYAKWDDEAFPASWSWYACDDCLFKHFCPKFKHMYMKDETIQINELWEDTIRKRIDRYAKMNDEWNALKKQAQSISKMLWEFANSNWVTRLYWETKKAIIVTKTTYSKDEEFYEDLRNKLTEKNKLDDVLDIDFNKLWAEFKEWDLDYDEFKELIKKSITTYISRTYDKKENEMNLDVLGNEELI